MGAPQGHLGQLHEVLQRAHLTLAVAVELVHADERHRAEPLLGVAFGVDVELVEVEAPQHGREQAAAEGALAQALPFAHEQRGQLVLEHAALAAAARPAAHHGAQPAAEHPLPLRVGAHLPRHVAHVVVPVPGGEVLDVVPQRVVGGHVGGEEVAVHPAAVAQGHPVLHLHHERIVEPLVEGHEVGPGLGGRTEFDVVVELVVAQFPALLDHLPDVLGAHGMAAPAPAAGGRAGSLEARDDLAECLPRQFIKLFEGKERLTVLQAAPQAAYDGTPQLYEGLFHSSWCMENV